MIDLKKFQSKNKLDFSYPPILDKDPTFAACFLTKEDAALSYKILKASFEDLDGENFKILKDNLKVNTQTFNWFVTFFKELEKILMIEERIAIPYVQLAPKGKVKILTPFYKNSKGTVSFYKVCRKIDNIIERHRVLYITRRYAPEDFYNGYPIWYSLSPMTVFEDYDARTNHRVRIMYRNGEFYYYLSGASDNWQQIMDVPIEIDYVISALLFRNLPKEAD